MGIKYFSAFAAVVLMIAYLSPMVFKLKEMALGGVVAIGLVMMAIDLWQSLQSEEG